MSDDYFIQQVKHFVLRGEMDQWMDVFTSTDKYTYLHAYVRVERDDPIRLSESRWNAIWRKRDTLSLKDYYDKEARQKEAAKSWEFF